jgi:hypothetical protein
MKPVALVLLALLIVPASSIGQVVARQGNDSDASIEEFKSPMILDLPFKDFRTIPPNTGKHFNELRKYYCDDLVISELLVSRGKDSRHNKAAGMILDMQGAVTVRPSYDRLATLRFDIVKGEERLASAQVAAIKAGEGKTRKFSTELNLNADQVARIFAAGPDPLLRVTVTVQSDR